MVDITIKLTAEQFAQYSNEDEIKAMVTNYANHKIDEEYVDEFKRLNISEKKSKVSLPKKVKEVAVEEVTKEKEE
jgi:ligand-binding sensor protein